MEKIKVGKEFVTLIKQIQKVGCAKPKDGHDYMEHVVYEPSINTMYSTDGKIAFKLHLKDEKRLIGEDQKMQMITVFDKESIILDDFSNTYDNKFPNVERVIPTDYSAEVINFTKSWKKEVAEIDVSIFLNECNELYNLKYLMGFPSAEYKYHHQKSVGVFDDYLEWGHLTIALMQVNIAYRSK